MYATGVRRIRSSINTGEWAAARHPTSTRPAEWGSLGLSGEEGVYVTYYLLCWRRYFQFAGRARRAEFWYFLLVNVGVSFLLGATDALLGFVDNEGNGLLSSLYGLAVFLPSLAVGTRRLHDTGRSGWWQLLFLIPLVGLIVLLYWFALPGGTGGNRYGDDPKTGEPDNAAQ